MKNISRILSRQSHRVFHRRQFPTISHSPPISQKIHTTSVHPANGAKNKIRDPITKSTMTTMYQHGPSASEFARTYNDRTGGCNIRLATHLIALVKPYLPPTTAASAAEPLRILDNACGPLVLTNAILHDEDIKAYANVHISAVDFNEAFIENNQGIIDAMEYRKGVTIQTAVMNGMDLKFPDDVFDVSFTSLGIFAFPDPVKGARELYRTLKPGGVAALTTWKRVGWVSFLHEVEKRVRPGEALTQFPFLEAWSVPGKLAETLREGGFGDVVEDEVVSYAWFEGEEGAARSLSETVEMLVGRNWGEGGKEKMYEGLRRGMEGGSELMRRGDGGKVGFEMVAWTGVGRK
jgi:SAM-dependent methyltransferase